MSYPITMGRWLMRMRPAPLASALKHLLLVRRLELRTPEGVFWIDPASYLGATLAQSGIYEPSTLDALKRLLRPGDTFVDVGANEGYFSVVAAGRVGAAGRVIAVEPQLRLQKVLSRNFQLNGCANIQMAAVAIADLPGEKLFHLTPDMNNSASGLTRPTRYRLATQKVRCQTLEEVFADHGVNDAIVKMDIESWEYEAILGSPALFRSGRVRELILELHPGLMASRGRSAREVEDFLSGCGYRHLPESGGLAWTRSQ